MTKTLDNHEVQIWHSSLDISPEQQAIFLQTLSPDEVKRAQRFRFETHRSHFIAARGILRQLLGSYLNKTPQELVFEYNDHGKPFLPNTTLQFNVSHSHDIAVYAFTNNYPIGIDIEQVRNTYEDAVAKRYFSSQEYADLSQLPESERALTFYKIWSRKEAIIKALGIGLSFPLSSFSVNIHVDTEEITLSDALLWHLESLVINTNYQSAYATQQQINLCNIKEFKLNN